MNIHAEATEQYLPEILFILLYKVKSYGVTIQMKANEWLFNVLLFILLYKEVITSSLWMKSYGVTIRVEATEHRVCSYGYCLYALQDGSTFRASRCSPRD